MAIVGVVVPLDYLFIRGSAVQRVKADLAADFDLASRHAFKIASIYLLHGMEQPH